METFPKTTKAGDATSANQILQLAEETTIATNTTDILAKIIAAPATEAKQDTTIIGLANLLTELQLKADLTESQPIIATDLDIRDLTNATDSILIYGSDDGGTTKRVIKTDAGGAIQVDLEVAEVTVTSSALPSGASTLAEQQTQTTALGTINTTLGSPFQSGGSISNTSFEATQAVGTNLHTVVDSGTITSITNTVSVTSTALDIRPLVNTDVVTAQLSAVDNAVLDSIVTNTTGLVTESNFNTKIGEVQATPTANTVLGRLANIESALAGTPTTLTPSKTTESTAGAGSVASGAKSVTIITSTDFVGTLLGDTATADSVYTFAVQGNNILNSIDFNITAGSLQILKIV